MNTTEKITISVYAQHCASAGKICREDKIESADIVVFEYPRAEMIELALEWLRDKTAGGEWKRNVARSILDEIDYKLDD